VLESGLTGLGRWARRCRTPLIGADQHHQTATTMTTVMSTAIHRRRLGGLGRYLAASVYQGAARG
jgi:hypothetical protein